MSKIDNKQKTLSNLIALAKANDLSELADVMNKYKMHLKGEGSNPLKPKAARQAAPSGPMEVTLEPAGDRVAMRTPFIPKGRWKAMYSSLKATLETIKYDPQAKAVTCEPEEIQELQEALVHFFGEGAKAHDLPEQEVTFNIQD